eukprot:TRINITY_DN12820_c0_g2_i2.p1 TRINITY_DN12820_c0_g2~~TRINITY_DN12820_c0_g2_i2.p1  ORF type:complete len:224 (-),score=44.18 TRINITY_DN12820_c0_g2_i2:852-1523(-)
MRLPEDLTVEGVRDSLAWRLGYAGPCVFSLLQVFLLLFVYRYESPLFYILNDDTETARRALEKIYPDEEDVTQVLDEVLGNQKSMSGESIIGSLYDTYKRAFWIGLLIPAIQQLTGINALMFYAPVIFSAGGKRDAGLVRVLTLITMIDNFVFTLVSAFISDKLGRKKLFIYGSLGCGISLLMAAVGASNPSTGKEMQTFDWIFAISLYVFVAFFGLSHGPAW